MEWSKAGRLLHPSTHRGRYVSLVDISAHPFPIFQLFIGIAEKSCLIEILNPTPRMSFLFLVVMGER